jgi:4-alpha-glucanotransferase
MKQRRAALETLAHAFFKRPSDGRKTAFESFRRANPALDDYAQFRAVAERQTAGWRSWPARLREGAIERGDYDGRIWQYHAYAQWIVQEQLERTAQGIRGAGGALYLDLPLGLHAEGYDTWRHRDLFAEGMAGGAPPDPLFTSGQNWGFPPLHPEITRRKRHAYTVACVRNHLKYGRLLRIDHVMGLHRLYWIPDGADGNRGVYVEYPADELYAILCLESHRAGAGIVGDNLGTVSPEVHTAMQRHRLRRLYVAQYEIGGDGLRPPPADTVASLNTHDTPSFRGFLEGRDVADHRDLGFIDAKGERAAMGRRRTEIRALARGLRKRGLLKKGAETDAAELLRASAVFLASSAAAVTLINAEDLWLEADPQNVPATGPERPNWKRRLRRSLERMQSGARIAKVLKDVDTAVARPRNEAPEGLREEMEEPRPFMRGRDARAPGTHRPPNPKPSRKTDKA